MSYYEELNERHPHISRQEVEAEMHYSAIQEEMTNLIQKVVACATCLDGVGLECKNLITTMHINGIANTDNPDVYDLVLQQDGFCDMVKYVGSPEHLDVVKWAQHIPSRKFITLVKTSK